MPAACINSLNAQIVVVWGDDPGEDGDALDAFIDGLTKTFFIQLVPGVYTVSDGLIQLPNGKPGTLMSSLPGAATLRSSVNLEFNNQCLLDLLLAPPGGQPAIQVATNQTQGLVKGNEIFGDVLLPFVIPGNPGNNNVVDDNVIHGSVIVNGNNNVVTNNSVDGCVNLVSGSGNCSSGNSCGGCAPATCNSSGSCI